ncbi:hypothetical protein [[Leptolyngbya] sp. PCC 7376]|uniref:hypothetical protein n=1 Tax=[Leptolyngbya] sp. PCC 7376 TaxID=111781 RepID=UPI00135B2CD7|nr:hypothetical protein [[Leptolyngbya] sp. PCC 7376]
MNLRLLSCASVSSLSLITLNACQSIDPVVYECQELLETINDVVIEAQTITQAEQTLEGEEPNLDVWLQAADTLKTGAEAIANIDISSPILENYQDKISEVYSEQAAATYSMVEAWQKKNLETALAAQTRTQAAGELEKTIGESLNNYCQDKEKELQQTDT